MATTYVSNEPSQFKIRCPSALIIPDPLKIKPSHTRDLKDQIHVRIGKRRPAARTNHNLTFRYGIFNEAPPIRWRRLDAIKEINRTQDYL
jgi:hypothetical protein